MAKKKPADHRTRLYRGSYERQTYLLRAELRIIRDDIRRLLAHVFVEHPIAIMLEPDPAHIEQVANELMQQDRKNAGEKKRRKHKAHQHIGVVVTFSGAQQMGRFETPAVFCIDTGDMSVYQTEEGFLPDGWRLSIQGVTVGPANGLWFNPDSHKEVTSASKGSGD